MNERILRDAIITVVALLEQHEDRDYTYDLMHVTTQEIMEAVGCSEGVASLLKRTIQECMYEKGRVDG